ncbi:prominin isoform X2 [Lycorma delicatula]
MRDALRNQISIPELIIQSLKLEVGFIVCLVAGVLLSLAAPIVVLSHTCYRLRKRTDDNSSDTWTGNCRRKTLVFLLQILIILLLIGLLGIIITNEQVSEALLESGSVLNTVLSDLDAYLGNTHLQINFAITKHLDQVVQAADSDLNNVEVLLGQPIQAELSRETGVDVALDSLRNIAQDASKVAELVELVQLAAGLVGEAIVLTREKLYDLRLQVDSFKRHCSYLDRSLCDTIDRTGLDITLNIDFLRQDDKLKRVRQMGGAELRTAVDTARILYRDLPRQVDSDTKTARQDVRRQLVQQRSRIDEDVKTLEIFFRGLKGKVIRSQNSLEQVYTNVPDLEYYRWIIGIGAAGSILLILFLLQSGITCGCCDSERIASVILLVSVVLICLVSTVLWILALIVLLVGGHGQAFVCRPLYQEPDFTALSQLLDQPGLFSSSHNFLSALTYNNDTMDVPVNKILSDCHINRAAYPAFQLKGLFNVDTISESRQWDSVENKLVEIKVKLNHMQLLSPNLYNQLDNLLQGLSVNITAHRTQLSEPLMRSDMNTFAGQLDSIGNQLQDLSTASRLETLTTRTRRLLATHIVPLEEKMKNLMFQLSALEVQLGPLRRQVEQSISHLKTIQFFIDNQGNNIADKKTEEYKNRLMSYIDQYRTHLTQTVNNDIARCQPIWNLFHATRLMICKHVMDPLNGFWFSIVWCLVVLLLATPVCLKLVDYYRIKAHSSPSHSSSPSETLMSNEQGRDWATPNGHIDNSGDGRW